MPELETNRQKKPKMKKFIAYTYDQPYSFMGGMEIDVEGMLMDLLITVVKANGATKEEFIKFISKTFDEIKVDILIKD